MAHMAMGQNPETVVNNHTYVAVFSQPFWVWVKLTPPNNCTGFSPCFRLPGVSKLGTHFGPPRPSLDCYWVGSLDFNLLGHQGVFH